MRTPHGTGRLQPHFRPDFKQKGDAAQQQAKKSLISATDDFATIMTEFRLAQEEKESTGPVPADEPLGSLRFGLPRAPSL
jgi:hypothetical protein